MGSFSLKPLLKEILKIIKQPGGAERNLKIKKYISEIKYSPLKVYLLNMLDMNEPQKSFDNIDTPLTSVTQYSVFIFIDAELINTRSSYQNMPSV